MTSWSIDLPNPAASERLAKAVAAQLQPGMVIGLVGELGSGKTTLVRALARHLDVPEDCFVCSPTFTLIHEYPGRLPLYHMDAYRLRSPGEFADLAPHDYFASSGITVIEWADRVADHLPKERLMIELHITGPEQRRAVLSATGERYVRLLHSIRQGLETLCS